MGITKPDMIESKSAAHTGQVNRGKHTAPYILIKYTLLFFLSTFSYDMGQSHTENENGGIA